MHRLASSICYFGSSKVVTKERSFNLLNFTEKKRWASNTITNLRSTTNPKIANPSKIATPNIVDGNKVKVSNDKKNLNKERVISKPIRISVGVTTTSNAPEHKQSDNKEQQKIFEDKPITENPPPEWKEFHRFLNENFAEKHKRTFTTLIATKAKNMRDVDYIRKMMSKLNTPIDHATFGVIFKLIGKVRDRKSLLHYLEEMKGIEPPKNTRLYNQLIVTLGEMGMLEQLAQVVTQITEKGILIDKYTITGIINALCRNNMLDDVLSLLDRIIKISDVKQEPAFYGTVMHHLGIHGRKDKAMELFDYMVKNNIPRNSIIYTNLFKILTDSNDLEAAEKLLEKMKSDNVRITSYVYSIMINYYSKLNNLEKAKEMFNEAKEVNELNDVGYNTLLCGFARIGDFKSVDKYIEIMKENKIKPTADTYNGILHVLKDGNELEVMQYYLEEMSKAGIKPDAITYTWVLQLLFTKGLLNEMEQLYNYMKTHRIKLDYQCVCFMIRSSINLERWDSIDKYLDDMKRNSLDPSTVIRKDILPAAVQKNKFDLIDKFYRRLRSEGHLAPRELQASIGNMYKKKGIDYISLRPFIQ